MADHVISFLVDNLFPLITQEVNLLQGVEGQVKSLHSELKLIQIFLKNSQGKRNEHELVKEVVNQIRDVAQEAEDIIETYMLKAAKYKRSNKLKKLFSHGVNHTLMLHNVAARIEEIKRKINEIYSNKEKYGFEIKESGGGNSDMDSWSLTVRKDVEEQDVVSFESHSKAVIEMLKKEKPTLDVISIIGMGGLGKTTLAKKIYNDRSIKTHFNLRAFVVMSQEFKVRDLFLDILKWVASIESRHYEMEDQKLREVVKQQLQGKRYLIVMDDVWRKETWDLLKKAFPENMNGSRILFTSRLTEVALHASPTRPYFLPHMGEDDSWTLFSKKVFRGEPCPPSLADLGRQLAAKCKGLPLALVVLGSLLATREKTHAVWSNMLATLSWNSNEDTAGCLDILALSYDLLPQYLRPCFLYLAVFPEDFQIPVKPLIRLWVAEGLIQHKDSKKLEDVAEVYLQKLIDRSLVKVDGRRSDGGVKSCRIHDLLRDLCVRESSREKFLEVHTNADGTSSSGDARRLSINFPYSRYVSSNASDQSKLRSLVSFHIDPIRKDSWKLLSRKFKLLRVLDLGYSYASEIPNEIGKLIHLRYLKVYASERVQHIPTSICNLWNLQTLHIGNFGLTNSLSLPSGVWKMQQLRHLLFNKAFIPIESSGANKIIMPNLQTLSDVEAESALCFIQNAELPNLRKLVLCGSSKKPVIYFECLSSLSQLQTLHIYHRCNFSKPKTMPLNLIRLTVTETYLLPSDLHILEELPNLKILKLMRGSISGHDFEWNCRNGSFPQLIFLRIWDIGMQIWKMGTGAMQCLETLDISCFSLTGIPNQLQDLCSMRSINVKSPSTSLKKQLLGLKMESCNIVISDA